jgi:hypothetical protein
MRLQSRAVGAGVRGPGVLPVDTMNMHRDEGNLLVRRVWKPGVTLVGRHSSTPAMSLAGVSLRVVFKIAKRASS